MSTTDIRILYPEGTIGSDAARFARKIEEILEGAGINPPRVCDMPSHVIITIATYDLFDVAATLKEAGVIK